MSSSANNHPAVGLFFSSFLSLFIFLMMGGFIVLFIFNIIKWMANKKNLGGVTQYPDEYLNWFLFGAIAVFFCWGASCIVVYKNLRSCITFMKLEKVSA